MLLRWVASLNSIVTCSLLWAGLLLLLNLTADATFSQSLPEGTVVQRDVPYVSNGHERQKLDLYRLAGGTKRPLIVWIHGGGWEGGDKRNPKALAALGPGIQVASVNYRLSQQAPFPAQLEDCKAAIRWLRAHSDEHGIDVDRIGVWGESAGGHLVNLLGATGETDAFDSGENLTFSSRVQAVVSFSGPTDLGLYRQSRADDTLGRLIGGAIQDNPKKVARANPITHLGANLPPFLLVHGDADVIVPIEHSRRFEAAIKQAGGRVRLHSVAAAGHDPTNQETMRMVAEFFSKELQAAPTSAKTTAPINSTKPMSVATKPASGKAVDELETLSDEFRDSSSLKNWKQVFETEGWGNNQLQRFEVNKSDTGKLVMVPHTSSWYRDYRGVLAFKEVTGDFVVTTDLEVHSKMGKGPPRSKFSLAGIMVRTPRDITPKSWQPGGENYVFLSLGAADQPGTFQFEVKTTINSDSQLQITPGVGRAQIQVARIGSSIITLLKLSNGSWQVHRRYQRPDFPQTLQVGLTCYTDWTGVERTPVEVHNKTVIRSGNPDLVAEFDFVRYRRPAVPSSLSGRNVSEPSQATDDQLLQFLGDRTTTN